MRSGVVDMQGFPPLGFIKDALTASGPVRSEVQEPQVGLGFLVFCSSCKGGQFLPALLTEEGAVNLALP